MATGNTARVHKLPRGIIAEGLEADLVIMDAPMGSVGEDALSAIEAGDVPGMFAAGFLDGGEHERRLGPIGEIPYLIEQDRWTFWRIGLVESLSLDDFLLHQGFKALQKAWEVGADAVIDAVTESGLRGRGGAGFPTGIKWRTVADAEGEHVIHYPCSAGSEEAGELVVYAGPLEHEGPEASVARLAMHHRARLLRLEIRRRLEQQPRRDCEHQETGCD